MWLCAQVFSDKVNQIDNKMETPPKFSSPAEEIEYWKGKAVSFEQQAKEVKDELEEFQEGSKELEQELETQLEQAEKNLKEYKSLTNRLQIENDSLKDKLEQCHKEYHYQVRSYFESEGRILKEKSYPGPNLGFDPAIRKVWKNYLLSGQIFSLQKIQRQSLNFFELLSD